VEVAGSRVIAETFPALEDLPEVGRRQGMDVRKSLDKIAIISDNGIYPGLLEHDFGDPDTIRIPCPTPWKVAAVSLEPREEHTTEFRYFIVLHTGKIIKRPDRSPTLVKMTW
jgi:hypothetical protein